MRRRGARNDLQFLTIVTFGRSGSTAIQAALNAHPRTLIRGENYLALRGAQAYLQSVAATADRHRARRPNHPWFGAGLIDPGEVRTAFLSTLCRDVLRCAPSTTWLGYKEVRYETGYFSDADALLDHLLFLAGLFPGIRFLVNVRGAQDCADSGWWPDNPDAHQVLTATIAHLREAAADLAVALGPGRVALVDHAAWAQDPGVLIEALESLQFPVQAPLVTSTLGERLTHGAIT